MFKLLRLYLDMCFIEDTSSKNSIFFMWNISKQFQPYFSQEQVFLNVFFLLNICVHAFLLILNVLLLLFIFLKIHTLLFRIDANDTLQAKQLSEKNKDKFIYSVLSKILVVIFDKCQQSLA